MNRNHTLDLFRLIAAFFVILTHTEYVILSMKYAEYIRLSSRWAVPCFFMVSGYFLAPKINNQFSFDKIQKYVVKAFLIVVVSSLVYLPVR